MRSRIPNWLVRFMPALTLALIALPLAAAPAPSHGTPHSATTAWTPSHGLRLGMRDTLCVPCRDFYRHANGRWLDEFQMPASYSEYGSFDEVYDRNQENVHLLLQDAVRHLKTARAGSDGWKLGTFFESCMDSARAEREGMRPITATLERIDALRETQGLAPLAAQLQMQGVPALFRFAARQDFANSSEMIAFATQGGLGLPDRDYYLRTDSTSRALLESYRAHVARTLALSGTPESETRAAADRIVALETALALGSSTNVQVRDPRANYHPTTPAGLDSVAPHFDWSAYLHASHAPAIPRINLAQPRFFHTLDSLLVVTPVADWKAYLRYQTVDQAAPWLSEPFAREEFAFTSQLSGEKEMRPRWKRCMQATDGALGDALGRGFVAHHFTPATRARVQKLVNDLAGALRERLGSLEWMSDTTRAAAAYKLAAFGRKIGYPEKWKDYGALTIEPGTFLPNVERANAFERARRLAEIGKPVDRTEWAMTPPTVNAYYNGSMNEIVFPAGILQPPFFDPAADDAVNYGAMGAVIGHEMSHGFDDRGRKFDATGNLRDWWTPGDATRFLTRAQKVIDQFDGYVSVDTLHVNGRLTTGENIADLGGLAIAYRAYQISLGGKPAPVILGYTGDQRFFLAYAQLWHERIRPEYLRTLTATDPHSPARWRVDGPLSNLPEFARAFHCVSGDPMVRPDSVRVRIW